MQLRSQASDCGPASLMMALRYHRIRVSLKKLREDTGGGRDGVSARSLLAAARAHGLPGRGVRTSLEGLRSLPSGSIPFWKFNHFVVLERATRQCVYIVDPAYGRRRLRTEDVGRLFTGVAIEFDAPIRSVSRSSSAEAPRSPWRHLAFFFPRSKKWPSLTAASLAVLVFGLVAPLSSAYVVDHNGLGGELTPVQAGLAVAVSATSFFLLQLVRLAAFFLVDPQVALWVSLLAVAQVGLLLLAWRPQVYLAADELECQAHSNSALTELLEGMGTVKAGGLDEVMGGRWTHSLMEEINAGTRRRRHFTLFSSLVASVQFMAPLLVLVTSAFKVSAGQLGLGEMTAFTSLSMGVFGPLTSLVQAGFQVAALKAPLTRLDDILDAEPDEPERTAKSHFDTEADLTVRGVRFQYPGATTPALTDIDPTISAGRFVAFLGPSGCGKSTLAMILSGLYRPSAGQVLIGAKAFDTIDRASPRRSISFVNQDARIFAGSIRDNITMGAAAEDDSMCDYVRAATVAQIHDEIAAMPMGYETLLGSGGSGLSGGQCQRIVRAARQPWSARRSDRPVPRPDGGLGYQDRVSPTCGSREVRSLPATRLGLERAPFLCLAGTVTVKKPYQSSIGRAETTSTATPPPPASGNNAEERAVPHESRYQAEGSHARRLTPSPDHRGNIHSGRSIGRPATAGRGGHPVQGSRLLYRPR